MARRIKKKNREIDLDFRRQIKDDKIYTCEKHFDPGDIEICKYGFINSSIDDWEASNRLYITTHEICEVSSLSFPQKSLIYE